MEATKDHLTEEERELLRMFREMDERGKRHLKLAAQSIKTAAEHQRERMAFSII